MAVIYFDSQEEEVRCVYTDYRKPLSPTSDDPNQEVFDEGRATGLNVEHIYPRNRGARIGNAEADMHHLAPSKVNVNSDRGNVPFGEIEDNATDRWYWQERERTSIPTSDIDQYSEWINTRFEPREDFKGNVARAMMYFYTMYRSEADDTDPDFFSGQVETLCQWHYADPVDSLEWHRTWRIAAYQEDKPNPFVLDCSVAARTYCPEVDHICTQIVDVQSTEDVAPPLVYPNPASDYILVDNVDPSARVQLFTSTGVLVGLGNTHNGTARIDCHNLASGTYFVRYRNTVVPVLLIR